jgi:hypothetical protein
MADLGDRCRMPVGFGVQKHPVWGAARGVPSNRVLTAKLNLKKCLI